MIIINGKIYCYPKMKSLRDEILSQLKETGKFFQVHTDIDFILEDEEYHKNKVIEDLSHYIGNNHSNLGMS
jgi:hypothetical protein